MLKLQFEILFVYSIFYSVIQAFLFTLYLISGSFGSIRRFESTAKVSLQSYYTINDTISPSDNWNLHHPLQADDHIVYIIFSLKQN